MGESRVTKIEVHFSAVWCVGEAPLRVSAQRFCCVHAGAHSTWIASKSDFILKETMSCVRSGLMVTMLWPGT